MIIYYYKKYKLLGEKEIYVKRAFNLFDEDKIFKEKYINLFHELTQITNNENLNNFLINNKIGRNEICQLCDSGKKYKKCCGKNISIN